MVPTVNMNMFVDNHNIFIIKKGNFQTSQMGNINLSCLNNVN